MIPLCRRQNIAGLSIVFNAIPISFCNILKCIIQINVEKLASIILF